MRMRRLASTPIPALLDRGRQEVARRVDRQCVSSGAVLTRRVRPGRLSPERYLTSPAGQPRGDAPGVASRCFFPGPFEAGTPASALDKASIDVEGIIDSASAYRSGRFDFLGYGKLHYGWPVDWHYDPVSGRRSPRLHWSLIDPLDASAIGDSKVIWELNRHQWLVRLGQAYCLDGDARYAEAFAGIIRDWMKHNPPGVGINWASSLEVAMRLISWCWALAFFHDSAVLTQEQKTEIRAWIGIHAAHIETYLSHSFSPNTHLTGEALGLYYAGTVFPELDAGGHWRRRGRDILLRELPKQVYEDGVYFEQSTCYQRYTLEIYLHFILLARINDEHLPGVVAGRVQALADWLLAVQHPDGSMPRIGDEDGGWLLPLTVRESNDFRGVFAVAAAVFRRADYAWAAHGEAAEVFWMLGRRGVRALGSLAPRPPRGPASRCFPKGGYAVMRDSWRRDAHQLIFDAGPLGCPHSAGHGHADLLSIQCASFGRPVLIDAGTYCYTPDASWRNYLRSTFAHNTAIIDGAGQAEPLGTFSWKSRPAARIDVWNTAPAVDYADAEHEAFFRLPGAVRHRRRVIFVKHGYWVIVDDFDGVGVHEIQLRYQFASGFRWQQADEWMVGHLPDGPGLSVRAFAQIDLTAKVYSGSLDPIAGWVSEAYGRLTPSPLLAYRAIGELPLRIVSVLVPVTGACKEPPHFQASFEDGGVCRLQGGGRKIVITDGTASIEKFNDLSAGRQTLHPESKEDMSCAP